MKVPARWLCILAVGLGALAPAAARAQTVDPQRVAAAQTLYEEATADMDAKRYVVACRKLEEVTRLVPDGLGAKLTLGDCYEAIGRRASAWAQYVAVEALAAKNGQHDRSARAAEKAAALRPKLATLVVEVPDAVRAIPGVAIARDGVPVGEVQWGTPMPVDAGGHEIVITAPGHRPLTMRVEALADGAKVKVTVKVPERAPEAPPGPKEPPERPWQRPVAIGAMGVGAAGVAAGALLGGLALAKNGASNADGHCDAKDFCDQTGFDLRNQARGFGNGSTAAIIAGGVVLAGGLVLFATAPPVADGAKGKERRAKIVVRPAWLGVEGTW